MSRRRPLVIHPTPTPRGRVVELRGPSTRLYGYLDVDTLTIEVKRKGEPPERIDLRQYLQERAAPEGSEGR